MKRTFLGFFKVLENKSPQIRNPDLPEDICRQFSLAEIKAATNNFHPDSIIGKTNFGIVYKGTINDGVRVAVKRCQIKESSAVRVFQNEVKSLCQLRHPHLTRLIGFCHEQNEIILVYEYMRRGSLFDYLFGNKAHVPLCWKQRLQICIGVARGLHYLHIGAKRAVIHRDIKSSNILLDDDWSSKLTDFGLSKIGPHSMSKSIIEMELKQPQPLGTFGYSAPEIWSRKTLTDKSDAYSFGVVLFEVLCGRQVIKPGVEQDQKFLIPWVCECMRNGTIYQTIEPYLKGKIAPSCLEKFLEIAFSCIRIQGHKRPGLGEVEATLELALELQNRADSEMERINPRGEGMYEEVLFSASAFF